MDTRTTARSPLNRIFRRIRSRLLAFRAGRGGQAGAYSYRFTNQGSDGHLPVAVWCRADGPNAIPEAEARSWLGRQTFPEMTVIGANSGGETSWLVSSEIAPAMTDAPFWFVAPGGLPDVLPTHFEESFLVAAAEDVDAVILLDDEPRNPDPRLTEANLVHREPFRARALFRSDAYTWDPGRDEILPLKEQRVVKVINPRDISSSESASGEFNHFRRGPYLSTEPLGNDLTIPVRDASRVERTPRHPSLPAVLVTLPFLARGGVEQTLYATLQNLADRFEFSIATFAPHRADLGDRRADFRTITENLYSLGDLVHPDVMLGVLESILHATGAEIIYNANGTTLFYDFAPRLKEKRPDLRIIDHLYDHEIGYIDRYDRELLSAVDACVAENHRIAQTLAESHGWPPSRTPVIWPCGRSDDELPRPEDRRAVRKSLRRELELEEDDVLFLTAARMHPQKRPLDLVRLAQQVRDLEHVHFLVVGGGELEDEIDEAIAAQPGLNIRRMAFRDDIPDLIAAADVGCLVSAFEGLPVFMLECLQMGRPFLGTRVGDLGRVLDETGAGVVVDQPGDIDQLESAVRSLTDDTFRSDLAEKAVQAAPRFSVDHCADAYAAVFLGAG